LNVKTYKLIFLSQVANINLYSRAHYRSFEYIKTINLCYVKDSKLKLLHSERHISSSGPFTLRIKCLIHFELRNPVNRILHKWRSIIKKSCVSVWKTKSNSKTEVKVFFVMRPFEKRDVLWEHLRRAGGLAGGWRPQGFRSLSQIVQVFIKLGEYVGGHYISTKYPLSKSNCFIGSLRNFGDQHFN